MAFENKTIDEVYRLIITGLETELNTRFRLLPKAFVRVLAKVLSAVFISLYKQQAWMFLQMFVDTATFDEVSVLGRKIRPLAKWGELVGVGLPNEATAWTGKAKAAVAKAGEAIPSGTQFVSQATQMIYSTTKPATAEGDEVELEIMCAEAGTAGNLDVGDEISTASPLVAIKKTAVITEANAGTDAETSDSYRKRVRARWQIQPQGGSLADYRNWASEVPGVAQTYVYTDESTSSGVLLYVASTTEDRIASPGLLREVGECCTYDPETGEARKPIGAVIDPRLDGSYSNVRPCEVLEFDVAVTGAEMAELETFKGLVRNAVVSYLLEREPYIRGLSAENSGRDKISRNNIAGLVNDCAIAVNGSFGGVELRFAGAEIDSQTLDKGQLAALGTLTVNGVES